MRNLLPLLLFLLLIWSGAAYGQKGENLYAAPGMPIIVARPLPAIAVPTGVAPVVKPWLTNPLPRFWENSDSLGHQQEYIQLSQALSQRLHYPKLAMATQLGGTVQVRVVVAPSGLPLAVNIIKSTLTLELADKRAGEALQNEALRVAQLLRFQPTAGPVDTVVVPITYIIQ
jgi:TonB family protein